MRTLDLDSLEIFRTVVSEGGVIRAASKLNRVQSNVTTRVRQLEERLGVRLFRRKGRALEPSPEGLVLLQYADRLLRLADEAQGVLQSGRPRGVFRLGSLESTAGSRLPSLLSRYHLEYPEVTVELVTGTTGALLRRMAAFEIEAAFISEPFTAPELNSSVMFDEELVLSLSRRSLPAQAAVTETLPHDHRAHIFRKAIRRIFHNRPVRPLSSASGA